MLTTQHTTCNVHSTVQSLRYAVYILQHILYSINQPTDNTLHKKDHIQQTPYTIQHVTRKIQYTTYNIRQQPTTDNLHHASDKKKSYMITFTACDIQHTACNVQHHIDSLPCAIYDVQQTCDNVRHIIHDGLSDIHGARHALCKL